MREMRMIEELTVSWVSLVLVFLKSGRLLFWLLGFTRNHPNQGARWFLEVASFRWFPVFFCVCPRFISPVLLLIPHSPAGGAWFACRVVLVRLLAEN